MTARYRSLAALAALAVTQPWAAAAFQGPPPGQPAPAPSAPGVESPSSPEELKQELAGLRDQKRVLKDQILEFEKKQVESAALNRARMGLGVTLAQEAMLTLRIDAIPAETFTRSSELIREAESYTVAVDTSSLTVDDQRVYSDLQAVLRRAIAQQVAYLHDRLVRAGVSNPAPPVNPGPGYAPPTQQAVYYPAAYTYVPATTCVPAQATRRGWSLFRRPSGR